MPKKNSKPNEVTVTKGEVTPLRLMVNEFQADASEYQKMKPVIAPMDVLLVEVKVPTSEVVNDEPGLMVVTPDGWQSILAQLGKATYRADLEVYSGSKD
jgi:hypothetical protein